MKKTILAWFFTADKPRGRRRIDKYHPFAFATIFVIGFVIYSNHVQDANNHRLAGLAVEYGSVTQDVDAMNELSTTSSNIPSSERELKLADAMKSCMKHADAYKRIASESPGDLRHYQDIQFICETRRYTIYGSPVH